MLLETDKAKSWKVKELEGDTDKAKSWKEWYIHKQYVSGKVMKGIKSDEPRLNLSGSWHRGHSHTYSPWFDS